MFRKFKGLKDLLRDNSPEEDVTENIIYKYYGGSGAEQ